MMSVLVQFVVWEWINIALEYTAVSWARLPRLFWAVVGVNLVTHPAFTFLLDRFGTELGLVLPCEAVIFLVEWALLVVLYGRARWRRLGVVAFTMNAVSYGTGVLMML